METYEPVLLFCANSTRICLWIEEVHVFGHNNATRVCRSKKSCTRYHSLASRWNLCLHAEEIWRLYFYPAFPSV